MSLLPEEPVSIAKVLDTSFILFKISFKKTVGFGLLLGLISAIIGLMSSLHIEGLIEQGSYTDGRIAILILGLAFVGFLSAFWLYGALIYRIDDIAQGGDASFGEALGVGLKKFPVMLFAVVLYSIAVLLGIIALVIPGLILSLSLFFYAYFIVLEDQSAYQSLKSSHKLVWKDWWRTAGVFTVPGVIAVIAVLGLGAVAGFLGGFDPDSDLDYWLEAGFNFLSGIFYQFFYVLGYVQFHDLKLRKTGSDLEARMADMGN